MNTYVFFLDSSNRMKRISEDLVTYAENELRLIEGCSLCYILANLSAGPNFKWFAGVCDKKHEIVWAKVVGFNYAPAKLLYVQDNKATVHFFGDHNIAQTSTKYIYLYSKETPSSTFDWSVNIEQVTIFIFLSISTFFV